MRKITPKSIKDVYIIQSNGEDVLVANKYLRLFHADGTFVTKFSDFLYSWRFAFLPNRTALVDEKRRGTYHYLSLETGQILWSTMRTCSTTEPRRPLAVSPDGTVVYDLRCTSHNGKPVLMVERICPEQQLHEQFRLEGYPKSITATFCDEEGTFCALFSHQIIDPEQEYSHVPTPRIRQYGFLAMPYADGSICAYTFRCLL